MAPPSEKPNTLHSAFIGGEYISGWEVSERDTWPHKRPRPGEECRRRSCARDARGLAPETSISDRFLLTLPFCFCVDAEKPARTLRRLCFAPPSSLRSLSLLSEGEKKMTAKVKSPQSTSNRRRSPFLLTTAALWLPWPAFPPAHSDVGHFTFVTSKTRRCP